jgi:hypothetical protein
MSTEMRNENVSKIILDIADFLEPIEFYLEQEVIIQSMTVFMGVEDICPNNADSHELIKMYRKNLKHTKMLIQDVSGVKQANLSFRNITRAQLNTPILEYFQKIQRKIR